MASYFFYQRRIPAYLTRLRHPYLLLADPKVPIGSDVIEIEWSKKFDFYVSIDQSDRKPRIANQVSKQLGFQRDLQCFTSANGAEIAQAMDEFSKIYRTFLNNCVHMIRHLLHRLCGPQVAKKAGKRLFNIIMYLGEKFPQKSHSTKQPMPYVITPPGSTSTYDMREVISSSSLANLLELSNVNDDEGFFEGDEDM
jgi:hypothetical protein